MVVETATCARLETSSSSTAPEQEVWARSKGGWPFDRVACRKGSTSTQLKVLDRWRLGHIQTETLLLRYAGEPLRLPQRGAPTPQLPFLRWHRKEVFRGPARAA
jgi:hypothetical protein